MSTVLFNKSFNPAAMPKNFDEAVQRAIAEDALEKYYIIVPTGKMVRQLTQKIYFDYFRMYDKPVAKTNIYTLQSFIKYCFTRIYEKHKYIQISEAYKLAIFEEASEKAGLKFFNGPKDKLTPAILKRLTSVISGIKEDGVTPQNLADDIMKAKDGSLQDIDLPRITDIYALYCKYNELLGDRYIDMPDMLKLTIRKMNESRNIKDNPNILPDIIFDKENVLLFDGFSDFKPPEIDFLSLFSASSIPTAINIDYDDSEGPLYLILEYAIHQLASAGFRMISDNGETTLFVDSSKSSRTGYLKHLLFSSTQEPSNLFSGIVSIFAFRNRNEEVKSIAKLIKYLTLKKNIQLHEICIALRQPNDYSELFREVFYNFRVPVNISDRFILANSPVIAGIFSVLDLITRGYRSEDLFRTVKNKFLTIRTINNDNIDIDNLINVTKNLKISGGNKRNGKSIWLKTMESTLNSLKSGLNDFAGPESGDPIDKSRLESSIREIERAMNDFGQIVSLVDFENNSYTPSEFREIIRKNIITNLDIERNIRKDFDFIKLKNSGLSKLEMNNILESIERDSVALTAFTGILDEMVYINADRFKGRKLWLNEWVDRLRTVVLGEKYQIKEKQNYGVSITSIEQTRNIPYKVVIICGLVDTRFPMAYQPESFLGKELPETEQKHILSERMQFYQALTNSPDKLDSGEKLIYLTYPKYEDDRELIRSPFVDALLSITTLDADGKNYDVPDLMIRKSENRLQAKELKQIESIPWLNSIASRTEFQVDIAERLVYQSENDLRNREMENENPESVKIENERNIFEINSNPISIANSKFQIQEFEKNDLKYIVDYIKFKRGEKKNTVRIDIRSLPEFIRNQFDAMADKPYSVTELETYAKCPYLYFLKFILKAKEEKELELAITPIDQGNFMHRVLYEFFTKLRNYQINNDMTEASYESDKPYLPDITRVYLDPAKYDTYLIDLTDIAKRIIKDYHYDHPFFNIDEVEYFGNEMSGGIIELWLREEIKRIDDGWEFSPVLFEFGFGMNSSKNKESIGTIKLGKNLNLRGKIDRIELGTNDPSKFIIADYKTSGGSLPKNEDIECGMNFQVPLYLAAAQKIFNEYYLLNLEPDGGVYYIFKPKYDVKKGAESAKFVLIPEPSPLSKLINSKQVLESREVLNDYLEHSITLANEIVENISSGIFDVKPQKKACLFCKFSSICRVNY